MKDNRGTDAPSFPREPIKGPKLDCQSCGYTLLRTNITDQPRMAVSKKTNNVSHCELLNAKDLARN
jgi:hypothetical protein